MPSFAELIQQGSGTAWLFIPSAILLGALHGLEPGHSKTLMAAFIVAIRGTVLQAVMLGLAATVSHTAVVWAIAFAGLYFYSGVDAESTEPYFQLASAVIIIGIALWMLWRTWQDRHPRAAGHAHHGHANHDHHHHHHDHDDHAHAAASHAHDHLHEDAHERAHAEDIRKTFGDRRNVTNWQIVLFGLTGGLIPCPAAITVLLLCIQLKEFTLGAVMVLCFSIGLALTLVSVGVVAAIGVRHVSKRVSWFSTFARRAPYVSGALIILVGLYVGWHGWTGLAAQAASPPITSTSSGS